MRSYFRFALILIAILTLNSCSSKSNEPAPVGPREVLFSFGGEFVDVTYEPLSRASAPAKYYGLNIYRKTEGASTYDRYAYGVFDDATKMKITLSPDYVYKFECTSLLEDAHTIAKIKDADGDHFMYPFVVGATSSATKGYLLENLNKFISSETENLSAIKQAKSTIVVGETDADGFAESSRDEVYPSQMRYYGEETDHKLNSSNTINITLKSISFGLRIVTSSISDGTITIIEDDKHLDLSTIKLTPTTTEGTIKFANNNWISSPGADNAILVTFTWIRDNGAKKESDTRWIDVRRNMLTTITLNLDNGDKDMTFSITEEGDLTTATDLDYDFTVK